jgi:Tol biopolymer transport system component
VSDRNGADALFVKDLGTGQESQLTFLTEPVREPSLSPDGRTVAFSVGGRIGVAEVATGHFQVLTLGLEWRDAAPSWRGDGKALVVSSTRPGEPNADVHLLALRDPGTFPERRVLTMTPGLDEQNPVFLPDGSGVVFGRQDALFSLDLQDGHTRRLTGGFRKYRFPRFLPSGRLACLWSEEKRFGIDVMDVTGRNRETLTQGSVSYRTLAPSPDGRFLAVTFAFDLSFRPAEALKLRQTEEVRLLDQTGLTVGTLARSWRYDNDSPDWAPQ